MTSVIFLPLWPGSVLWGGIGLLLTYWAIKRQLLRLSSRPYRLNVIIARRAHEFINSAAVLFAIASFWFLSPSLKGTGEHIVQKIMLPLVLLATCIRLLPQSAKRLLTCRCCSKAIDAVMELDYYDVQLMWPKHEKYHVSHPVYQNMESLWLRDLKSKKQEVELEWDLQTGDFPFPGGTVDPAPKVEDDHAAEYSSWTDSGATSALRAAYNLQIELQRRKERPSPFDIEKPKFGVDTTAHLSPGKMAVIVGLMGPSAESFNGKECQLIEFDNETKKWLVKLHSSTKGRISEDNLRGI